MSTIWLILPVLLLALGAGIGAVFLSDLLHARAKVSRRLLSLGELVGGVAESSAASTPTPTSSSSAQGEAVWLAWFERRFPLAGAARIALIAAGVALLVLVAVTAFLVFVHTPVLLAIALALACATGAAWGIGSILEGAKREEYSDRLLLAMDDFQRMVRFGIPTMQALTSAADAAEEPLSSSLRNILLETGFGVPLEHAVATEARRVRMAELAMLAAILSTQASTGGNLSESVGNLATMLRERRDNRAKMKAATAESRITLIILALVPIVGIGIQAMASPEVVATLLNEARHLLGIGVGLIVGAFVLSWLFIRSAQR